MNDTMNTNGENQPIQSNNLNNLEDKVLQHLKSKYNEDFSVLQNKREFSGERGEYFRVVCKSSVREEKCVVYCYPENKEYTSYEMIDDYANIVLQEKYAQEINEIAGEGVLVKCQLFFPNHMLSDQEYLSGTNVLKKSELYPRAYVYVFSKLGHASVRTQVENYMKEKGVYMQYLYVTYQENIELKYWEDFYYENYNSFERYLKESDKADVIEFTSITLEDGIQTRKTVKE